MVLKEFGFVWYSWTTKWTTADDQVYIWDNRPQEFFTCYLLLQIASVINNVQCMLQLATRHQHLLNAEWLHQTNSCFSFLDHLIHGRHNYCQKTPELSAWREDAVPVKWWYIFWLNFPLKILSIAPLTLCECK